MSIKKYLSDFVTKLISLIPFLICSCSILFFELWFGAELVARQHFPSFGWIIFSFGGFLGVLRNGWGQAMANRSYVLILFCSVLVPLTLFVLKVPMIISEFGVDADLERFGRMMYFFLVGYVLWATVFAAVAWRNSGAERK